MFYFHVLPEIAVNFIKKNTFHFILFYFMEVLVVVVGVTEVLLYSVDINLNIACTVMSKRMKE